MKSTVIVSALVLVVPGIALAQTQPAPAPAPSSAAPAAAPAQKSLSQNAGLYVFPAKEQTKEVQAKDETDCYAWAKQSTGTDPLAPAQAEAPAQAPDQKGGAVKGGAKGAAAGALIGAAAGDAGKGAAIGAAAGGVAGRSKQTKGNAAADQKAQDQQKQAAANVKTEFNKAFGACLEGKGYTVK